MVGEGVAGAPAIGPVECPNGGVGPEGRDGRRRRPRLHLQPGRTVVLRPGAAARTSPCKPTSRPSPQKYDTPAIPAFGHPIFAGLGPTVVVLHAGQRGLVRALDIAVNEYQGGQDFMAGWEAHTGQFRPGWPAPVNDLQFLTGPVGGERRRRTGRGDHRRHRVARPGGVQPRRGGRRPRLAEADRPTGWSRTRWSARFGTIDTDGDARNRIVAITRSGSVLAYARTRRRARSGRGRGSTTTTRTPATTGVTPSRPGKPIGASVSGTTVNFTAPGDDLLCGTADHYEIVTSNDPIDGDNFDQADQPARTPRNPKQPAASSPTRCHPARRRSSRFAPSTTRATSAARRRDDRGYPRPAGATPAARVRWCPHTGVHVAERTARAAARPPVLQSAGTAVGDSDGRDVGRERLLRELGRVRAVFRQPGEPSTSADEADVGFELSATDVRCAGTSAACPGGLGSDYAGRVLVATTLRITDRDNDVGAGGGYGPGHGHRRAARDPGRLHSHRGHPDRRDMRSDDHGGLRPPGAVNEGDRSIWQMGPVELRDAGPNGSGYGSGCPSSAGMEMRPR